MTLRNVGVGQTVTVSKITGVGAIKRRIMDGSDKRHIRLCS